MRSLLSILSFSLVSAAPLSALAEEAPASDAPASETQPTGDLSGASVESATDEQKAHAQEAFLEGDKAFDVQDYDNALLHFRESYGVVKSPNSRLMVARCLLEMDRLDEAYAEYSGVIADAQSSEGYEETANTAQREQEALQHRLAWLTLDWGDISRDSRLTIAGRDRSEESQRSAPLALNPGSTEIEVETPDGQIARAEVHLAAGRKETAQLVLGETVVVGTPIPVQEEGPESPVETEAAEVESPPPQEPPKRKSLMPAAIATGAVGLVGAAGFVTFGLLSKKHYDQLQEDCTNRVCPPSSSDDVDKGQTYQLLANISLGVGVAGIGTSIVLLVLDQTRKPRPVAVDVGFQNITVRGTF